VQDLNWKLVYLIVIVNLNVAVDSSCQAAECRMVCNLKCNIHDDSQLVDPFKLALCTSTSQ